eukprot:GHRR01030168.1.p1 GENE.GHRR01030168.1~~GHRR01030168.1.p1  ORF type:complete len:114 (+),score=24.47 GHRR01030168.1:593-934(+)
MQVEFPLQEPQRRTLLPKHAVLKSLLSSSATSSFGSNSSSSTTAVSESSCSHCCLRLNGCAGLFSCHACKAAFHATWYTVNKSEMPVQVFAHACMLLHTARRANFVKPPWPSL